MNRPDLALRCRHVLTASGVREAAVWIADGRVTEIVPPARAKEAARVLDLGDAWLMPGLVDTHVHVNEPGRSEWEGFRAATAAAAAGGVTTLVDMPLNSVPATTTAAALEEKRAAAAGACSVDVGFWGGVVPGNTSELKEMEAAGVLGFKAFLAPSGVPEFEAVSEADLRAALPVLRELRLPLLVHAESPRVLGDAAAQAAGRDPRAYSTWQLSRPEAAEVEAVRLVVELAAEFGTPIHVVHVSSTAALEVLREARVRGLPVTAETCPHYLTFASETIVDGDTLLKCAPPIRDAGTREALWRALGAGVLDLVATDHSPCPPELKLRQEGDFLRAWGGIASLQLGLSATWSEARRRGFQPPDLARWMCAAPARLAGLANRKGTLAPGLLADLVAWHPEERFEVRAQDLRHRHAVSPYLGRMLHGVVEKTVVGGRCVYDRAGGAVAEGAGSLVRRGAA